MRSGKRYLAMRTAVLHSYTQQKPVAVLTEATAQDMLFMAKKMGISIPAPVVVKPKAPRKKQVLYEYIDEGGY